MNWTIEYKNHGNQLEGIVQKEESSNSISFKYYPVSPAWPVVTNVMQTATHVRKYLPFPGTVCFNFCWGGSSKACCIAYKCLKAVVSEL